ncbi:MAG: AAA family ATPase [Deltaproteobacteria bacterium]|nr:AAA family ATPase [Deltaproteobacteria bacterium]
MARVLAVTNQKGGVGKTTTAVNLGASLAVNQKRTLLIDLDPQGNASTGVGATAPAEGRSIYDVLIGDLKITEVVQKTEVASLEVVPSSADLAGAEVELVGMLAREKRLAGALRDAVEGYDYVLIDCPPSLGLLTVNALTAADAMLVPLQCEYYALEGLARLFRTADLIREALNPQLGVAGIVLTMVDMRNNLAQQVALEVRKHFPQYVFETTIPRNVRLSEAPSHGKPILLYDVHSRGALSYLDLAREFLGREGTS